MAKKKGPEKTPAEIRREAANAAADGRRARERDQRQANADKQRRFRESMKAQGMKQILLWDYPPEPGTMEAMAARKYTRLPAWEKDQGPGYGKKAPADGTVRIAAVIHESTLDAVTNNPTIKQALSRLAGGFIKDTESLPRKEWEPVYRDIQELLRALGNE
jgi:hypothetical protein